MDSYSIQLVDVSFHPFELLFDFFDLGREGFPPFHNVIKLTLFLHYLQVCSLDLLSDLLEKSKLGVVLCLKN